MIVTDCAMHMKRANACGICSNSIRRRCARCCGSTRRLLSSGDYLATYPVLAAFLQQHPEVAHNPSFFIGEIGFQEENRNNPQMEAARALRNFIEGMTVVLIVMTITTG